MKTIWNDFRQVWRVAVLQRRQGFLKVVGWTFLACFVEVAAVMAAPGGPRFGWRQIVGFAGLLPLGAVYLGIWVTLISGALQITTPANARLVPHARRRAITACVLYWLAGMAGFGLAIEACFGQNGAWYALLLGYATLWLALTTVTPAAFAILPLAAALPFARHLPPPGLRLEMGSGPLVAAAALALPLAAVWVLRSVFPRGAERQRKVHAWSVRSILQRPAEGGQHDATLSLRQPSSRLYRWALRRDCAARSQRLMLHVLGPGGHWTGWCALLVPVLGLALLAKGWLLAFPDAPLQAALGHLSLLPALGFALYIFVACVPLECVPARAAEQALFRLAPLAPPASGLNRALAVNLLRNGMLAWLLLLGTVLALSALMGAGTDLLLIVLSLSCMGLPFLGVSLLDYAGKAEPRRGSRWVWAIIACWPVLMGLAMLGGNLARAGTWIGFALLNLALAGGFVAWRWRGMMAAPAAFPAGRMAG